MADDAPPPDREPVSDHELVRPPAQPHRNITVRHVNPYVRGVVRCDFPVFGILEQRPEHLDRDGINFSVQPSHMGERGQALTTCLAGVRGEGADGAGRDDVSGSSHPMSPSPVRQSTPSPHSRTESRNRQFGKLIQMRQDRLKLRRQYLHGLCRHAHTRPSTADPECYESSLCRPLAAGDAANLTPRGRSAPSHV